MRNIYGQLKLLGIFPPISQIYYAESSWCVYECKCVQYELLELYDMKFFWYYIFTLREKRISCLE